jgi:hypothetical protein
VQVTTVLGPLLVSDPPPGTSDVWAQAVSLCARDMTALVGKVPDRLRPSARVLARAWSDDSRYADAVRSIETHDLGSLARWQAMLPDVSEATPTSLAQVHAIVGDQARGSTGRLLTIAQMLAQGRIDEARKRVASGWSKQNGSGGALVTVGALRAHTGAALTAAAFDRPDGSVIDIP